MNLENKICLITGATSGIGKQTAIALAKTGAKVIFTARSKVKGENVLKEIINLSGNNKVEMMELDLASMEAIRRFADQFKSKYSQLHILINNAGGWYKERKVSADGIELSLAANHLGPFLLTNLLLDLIKNSAPARIISVSSAAHKNVYINFNDLEAKKEYKGFKVYSQSKLANILFTKKLAKMLEGTGVTANCLHPGVVNTSFFNQLKILKALLGWILISPKKGAETSIYLATSDEVEHVTGEYFAKKKIAKTNSESRNMEIADKLWEISKKYVNL